MIEAAKPRLVNQPEPGFFKLRLVKGGPFVGAQITFEPTRDPICGTPLDRSPMWSAWIDGKLVADPSPDPLPAGVFRIWHYGREITEDEYRYLVGVANWARINAPDDPAANPRQPIDPLKTPIPF